MHLPSRRELFGLAAAPLFAAARANEKVQMSLIIDDGAPVDPMYYENPGYQTEFLIPPDFTRKVADTFERFDLRGKFTVIPMPNCLGRLDQSLKLVPPERLSEFLKVVRERIAPRFDITPEYLTHSRAYNLKKEGRYLHVFEDGWISRAPVEEIAEYFALAFQILRNVGLEANGITSPWYSGIDVEKKYARGLADAQWKVFQRKLTWYFLHVTYWDEPRQCLVECDVPERGQVVVSVPANTDDVFWPQEEMTRAQQREHIQKGIDRLLSADGRTGRLRQLVDTNFPVVLVTHWQSLFYQGTGMGLEGLAALAERIRKVFGNNVEWITCSEQARKSAKINL